MKSTRYCVWSTNALSMLFIAATAAIALLTSTSVYATNDMMVNEDVNNNMIDPMIPTTEWQPEVWQQPTTSTTLHINAFAHIPIALLHVQ
jgi:hypothetical protein